MIKRCRRDWWHQPAFDWHWLIPLAIPVAVLILTVAMVIAQMGL